MFVTFALLGPFVPQEPRGRGARPELDHAVLGILHLILLRRRQHLRQRCGGGRDVLDAGQHEQHQLPPLFPVRPLQRRRLRLHGRHRRGRYVSHRLFISICYLLL